MVGVQAKMAEQEGLSPPMGGAQITATYRVTTAEEDQDPDTKGGATGQMGRRGGSGTAKTHTSEWGPQPGR